MSKPIYIRREDIESLAEQLVKTCYKATESRGFPVRVMPDIDKAMSMALVMVSVVSGHPVALSGALGPNLFQPKNGEIDAVLCENLIKVLKSGDEDTLFRLKMFFGFGDDEG